MWAAAVNALCAPIAGAPSTRDPSRQVLCKARRQHHARGDPGPTLTTLATMHKPDLRPLRPRFRAPSPSKQASTPLKLVPKPVQVRPPTPRRTLPAGGSRARAIPVKQRATPKHPLVSLHAPQPLATVLSRAGVAARRKAADIVRAGRVQVNGVAIFEPGSRVMLARDVVVVDGKLSVSPSTLPPPVYLALYKPKGYACDGVPGLAEASGDSESKAPSGRQKSVMGLVAAWLASGRALASASSLFKNEKQAPYTSSSSASRPRLDPGPGFPSAAPPSPSRLFTVGRLDAQTSGLLFVTNDGAWAARVAHPSTGVLKEYRASVVERVTARHLDRLGRGCEVRGRWVRPVAVRRQPERADGVEVVVGEGRHREVRELLAAAELSLKNLRRVQVGDYRLPPSSRPGEVVELSAARAWRLVGGRG